MRGPKFSSQVLQVTCPVCHCGGGHWCRDEKGKAVHPHRERSRLALGIVLAPYSDHFRPHTKANFAADADSVRKGGRGESPEQEGSQENESPFLKAFAAMGGVL